MPESHAKKLQRDHPDPNACPLLTYLMMLFLKISTVFTSEQMKLNKFALNNPHPIDFVLYCDGFFGLRLQGFV